MAPQKPRKKPRNYTTSGTAKSGSGSKAKSSGSKASAKTTKVSASKEPTAKASGAKASGKKPAPNMQERMEGLQGWMAEIERKQGRMTYFGAAAALVAIAASAGALYLGVTTKDDAATKDDVDEIQTQIEGTQVEVKQTVEKALKDANDRIATLEQSVADLKQKQAQDAEDIVALQNQSNAGGQGAGRRGGAGTGLNASKP